MIARKIVRIPVFLAICCTFCLPGGCGQHDSTWIPRPDASGKRDGLDQVSFFDNQLQFSGSVSGEFTRDQEAHGWWFEARAGSRVSLEVTHLGTSTLVDTSLFLYGPLDQNGSLGEDPTAWDDDSGWGYNPELVEIDLLQGGRYLAVVATWDGLGRGHYRLELRCLTGENDCLPEPSDSCLQRCGEYSDMTCSCDDECNDRGDCCLDRALACDFQASEIHRSWLDLLIPEFEKESFSGLMEYLDQQYRDHTVYPPKELVFNALIHSPLDRVKVVILGQDPYHGEGQAHGFSFSVPEGIPIPPSLRNIFKEVSADMAGIEPSSDEFRLPESGNLIPWADQGVLLLNVVLTVREAEPNSHKNQGWEPFTERVITLISEHQENVVFMLWGSKARAKAQLIDDTRHLILEAAHPSPLATGFPGCKHFSQANRYLEEHGRDPIDWHDSLWP